MYIIYLYVERYMYIETICTDRKTYTHTYKHTHTYILCNQKPVQLPAAV